jgi:hypothetical protein
VLDCLNAPFEIADAVAHEMRHGHHGETASLGAWLDAHANRIEIVETRPGRAFMLALKVDPDHYMPDFGERAVAEFVADRYPDGGREAVPLALFEDRDILSKTVLPHMKRVHLINLAAFVTGLGAIGALDDARALMEALLQHGKLNAPHEKRARTRAVQSVRLFPPPRGIVE